VKHFASALGPRGIRVNAVAPGVVDTDMSSFAKTEAGREVTLGMQALKRLAQPDDIARVVAFLASDDARWITATPSMSTAAPSSEAASFSCIHEPQHTACISNTRPPSERSRPHCNPPRGLSP